MNINASKSGLLGMALLACTVFGCSKSDDGPESSPPPGSEDQRWITVAGALMESEPGDGNGGMMVYSVTLDEAKNPDFSIDVFGQGVDVKSSRTARLQVSEDGRFLYNIQYSGADGGIFNKYSVKGGRELESVGSQVNAAPYVGTSPRWAKVSEKAGVAVTVKDIVNIFDGDGDTAQFQGVVGTAVVLVLDLEQPRIMGTKEFPLSLSPEEQAQGYHIWRLDAPAINKAGDKLYVGTWLRKYAPGTTTIDANSARLGTKTLVLDYPSLENPQIISSTVATGDNSGYRSPMSYLGTDGNMYQGTHRELPGTGGSHLLKIDQQNQYDNSYVFSLDAALGVTDSYIESWKYAGEGIAYVIYSLVADGVRSGGYIAQIDLNNRTARKISLPGESNLDFGQYQGIAVVGKEVFIAVTEVSKDGNIYIFNRETSEVTLGAKLINKAGNRYIGVY